MFPILGKLFRYAEKDARDKLSILHQHRESTDGQHYLTVESMVDFETTNGLATNTGKPPSGSRTLLRLHRALRFITAFLRGVRYLKLDEKLSGVATETYDSTLADFHVWPVQQITRGAFYTLPTKHQLAIKMGHVKTEEYDKIVDKFCDNTQRVYDKIQAIYTKYDVLQLP